MQRAILDRRYSLRPIADGDAAALYAAVRGSLNSLSHWFPWCNADYALADAEERVLHCLTAWVEDREYAFAVFDPDSQALLACVGLSEVDRAQRSANLGYWVGETLRGQGIATAAAAAVIDIAFSGLDFDLLQIAVLPHNHASRRVAEKLGASHGPNRRKWLPHYGEQIQAICYCLTAPKLQEVSACNV